MHSYLESGFGILFSQFHLCSFVNRESDLFIPCWSFLRILTYWKKQLLKGTVQATASMGSSSNSERQQQGAKRAKLSKASSALKDARAKESAVQRQHPGMTSANDRSTAHNGSVTALQTSDDGFHLFSAGRPCRAFFRPTSSIE